MAEVTWSPASARDWDRFLERLPAALRRAGPAGRQLPGAQCGGAGKNRLTPTGTAVVTLTSPLANGIIRYTIDSTTPTENSAEYTAPLTLTVDGTGTVVTAVVFLPSGASSPPRQARFSKSS